MVIDMSEKRQRQIGVDKGVTGRRFDFVIHGVPGTYGARMGGRFYGVVGAKNPDGWFNSFNRRNR